MRYTNHSVGQGVFAVAALSSLHHACHVTVTRQSHDSTVIFLDSKVIRIFTHTHNTHTHTHTQLTQPVPSSLPWLPAHFGVPPAAAADPDSVRETQAKHDSLTNHSQQEGRSVWG